MHIYAFGSVCRGDVSLGSDVDLLAVVEGFDARFSPEAYSIYSYRRIQEIWDEGNPFAWHLSREAKLLFTSDATDVLRSLGSPAPYRNCSADCAKFHALFRDAMTSAQTGGTTLVFDLSTIFLSVRNIATCFSLGVLARPDFSRHSALRLGDHSLEIPRKPYEVLERSRILCTRGYGNKVMPEEAEIACAQFPHVEKWMNRLSAEAQSHAARI
jgi:hypothetical protein